jgi:protein-tyrosine phosphatase
MPDEPQTPRLNPAAAFSRAGKTDVPAGGRRSSNHDAPNGRSDAGDADDAAQRLVLFLCTGNYYRSRFAEILFNVRAAELNLPWLAISRGLQVERGKQWNVGPISQHTLRGLARRGIPVPDPLNMPQQATLDELQTAAQVIALNEPEHRPMLTELHPEVAPSTIYWTVCDLDKCGPDDALDQIAAKVESLISELQEENNQGSHG